MSGPGLVAFLWWGAPRHPGHTLGCKFAVLGLSVDLGLGLAQKKQVHHRDLHWTLPPALQFQLDLQSNKRQHINCKQVTSRHSSVFTNS